MSRLLFSAATLLLGAAPAFAADGDRQPFNGPYIGVQAGWRYDHSNLSIAYPTGTNIDSQGKSGFSWGGQAGYDLRVAPGTIIGAEASVTGTTGNTILGDGSGGLTTASLKQGRTIDVSARFGHTVIPTGLAYVRAGYTNAAYTLTDGATSASDNRSGYLLGLGYEQMLANHLSARLEYDYSNFASSDQATLATALGGSGGTMASYRHGISAGLNYRF
jgi:outer membrane immunogenic protein